MRARTTLTRPRGCVLANLVTTLALASSAVMLGCGSSNSTTAPSFDSGPGDGSSGDSGHKKDSSTAHDATGGKKDTGGGGDAKEHVDSGKPHDGGAPDAAQPEASLMCPDASVVDGATVLNCTGRCGPIVDPCTGTTTQCGGCPNVAVDGGAAMPQVCDLATNTCGPVLTTCAELGAQCGTVSNSCGAFLDCPDGNPKGCPMGQECDTDTNQCVTCQQVSCIDLGFACGMAWLGCGPDTPSNYTDCGMCGTGQVCNGAFNLCEPNCMPGTAATLCAAASAQCGIITDGCGGTVDCDTVAGLGCPSGQSCGVSGEANQCDPAIAPPECAALGRNCGQITSVCTGKAIDCGQCPTGQVCNSNGVCGAPCMPNTCADHPGVQCGNVDDGCGGKIPCGSCEGGALCNQATNMCCTTTESCAVDYAGQCGTSLANGCGSASLNCPCASPEVCTSTGGASGPPAAGTTGMCCTPKTDSSFSAGQCGTAIPDGCGKTLNVPCPGGEVCTATGGEGPAPPNGTLGSCCTRTDMCPAAGSNTCSQVANSCTGNLYTCNECGTGTKCNMTNNACCTPPPACMGGGGVGGECNTSHTTASCGTNTCNCNGNGSTEACICSGHVCGAGDGAGTCMALDTCNTTYKNECGTGLTNGFGGTINCGCPNGMKCSTSTAGATGSCACDNGIGAPYTCANVPMGTAQCGSFSDGCGGNLTCNCPPGGDVCNSAKVCCMPATCPAEGLGSACGGVNNGCTTVQCGCPGGTNNKNFTCTANVCACIPDSCEGRTGTFSDGCGQMITCVG